MLQMTLIFYSSLFFLNFSPLPCNIDPEVAINALRIQHDSLCKNISHCLPTVADSLFAQFIIPGDIRERACNQLLGSVERAGALLDCVRTRIEAVPSDFKKVVEILKSDPFLESLEEELIRSYSK